MSVKEVVEEVESKVEDVVKKVEDEFTQNKALEVLVQAVKLAQKRGAYELEETEIILKAIKAFVQKVV
jgi:hypothetical protein